MNYFKIYGFSGVVRLIIDKIYTLLFFRRFRILRRPYYIRGNRKGIKGGVNLTTGVALRIDLINYEGSKPELIIGDNVQINDYVHIGVVDKVSIGDNTIIGSKVFISDHNHGNYSGVSPTLPDSNPIKRKLYSNTVEIGKNVWIGEFVSILPGVKIGDGAVVGSMSLVTKDIPPNTINIGVPSRIVKKFDEQTNTWKS